MAISIIRTVIVFLALIISMRVMGKRQLGELEPAELVIAVLISDLASHPLQDPGIPLLYGLIPVITLLCCEVLISAGLMKSVRFRTIVCGKPSLLISNGKIMQEEMRKNRVTLDELMEELRKKDISDISTVRYAILETDGTLSTILYAAKSPVTPEQMGIVAEEYGYAVIVINDGRILDNNLKILGFDRSWLDKRLHELGVKNADEVYFMTVNSLGTIYFAKKEKQK